MKRFSFTLRPLLEVKLTHKKQKQQELFDATARLHALVEQRRLLQNSLEDGEQSYHVALCTGMHVTDMAAYSDYFRALRVSIAEQEQKISQAQQQRDGIQAGLVTVMREIETLEKLKQEQYRAYLKELAREEEKELEDLMSFQSATGGGLMPEMA